MTSGIHQIIDRQIRRWDLEAQQRRESAEIYPSRPASIRPWITISRCFGSGGGEIAQRLSARLNYEIFDREIVDTLVRESAFRSAILESLDERDRSSLEIWIEGLLRGRLVDKEDYLRSLIRVIGVIALHGHAIIVGRGANLILDSDRGIHVRIVAPLDQRIETIARIRSMAPDEARKLVEQVDEERAAFIRRHFHRQIEDPLSYDLVVNSARLGVGTAVELIERGLREKLASRPHVQF